MLAHDPPLTSPTPSQACPDTDPLLSLHLHSLSVPSPESYIIPFLLLLLLPAAAPTLYASPIQDKQNASSSGDTQGPFNKAIYHADCPRLLWTWWTTLLSLSLSRSVLFSCLILNSFICIRNKPCRFMLQSNILQFTRSFIVVICKKNWNFRREKIKQKELRFLPKGFFFG